MFDVNKLFGATPEGTLEELPRYVEALMAAGGVSFLAVSRKDADDFMQMTAIPGGVELDFPLVTDAQIAGLDRIRSVGKELGLVAREAIGGEGDDFIDFDVLGAPDAVASTLNRFFEKLTGATAATPVTFEVDGFEV